MAEAINKIYASLQNMGEQSRLINFNTPYVATQTALLAQTFAANAADGSPTVISHTAGDTKKTWTFIGGTTNNTGDAGNGTSWWSADNDNEVIINVSTDPLVTPPTMTKNTKLITYTNPTTGFVKLYQVVDPTGTPIITEINKALTTFDLTTATSPDLTKVNTVQINNAGDRWVVDSTGVATKFGRNTVIGTTTPTTAPTDKQAIYYFNTTDGTLHVYDYSTAQWYQIGGKVILKVTTDPIATPPTLAASTELVVWNETFTSGATYLHLYYNDGGTLVEQGSPLKRIENTTFTDFASITSPRANSIYVNPNSGLVILVDEAGVPQTITDAIGAGEIEFKPVSLTAGTASTFDINADTSIQGQYGIFAASTTEEALSKFLLIGGVSAIDPSNGDALDTQGWLIKAVDAKTFSVTSNYTGSVVITVHALAKKS